MLTSSLNPVNEGKCSGHVVVVWSCSLSFCGFEIFKWGGHLTAPSKIRTLWVWIWLSLLAGFWNTERIQQLRFHPLQSVWIRVLLLKGHSSAAKHWPHLVFFIFFFLHILGFKWLTRMKKGSNWVYMTTRQWKGVYMTYRVQKGF